METIIEYVIVEVNGEEHIFEDFKDAFAFFTEIMKVDTSRIEQFYSKEWGKESLSDEEFECGYEYDWEEGDVVVLYDKAEHFNTDTPMLLEFEDDMYYHLKDFPNFHITGNIEGMRRTFYGSNAYLVKCEDYIYNVDKETYYGLIDGFQSNWLNTDDNQLMQRVSNDLFIAINAYSLENKVYLGIQKIDLSEYDEDSIESYIRGYYNSLNEVKEIYGDKDEDAWKLVVAEIISEVDFDFDPCFAEVFDNEEDMNDYLKELNINNTLNL